MLSAILLSIIINCLVIHGIPTSENTIVTDQEYDYDGYVENLKEWLISNGGKINEKLKFQKLNNTISHAPYGIIASEFISKNEELIKIPKNCMIQPGIKVDEEKENVNLICTTNEILEKELTLKENSRVEPFLNYLFETSTSKPFATWSKKGIDLIDRIIGPELAPWEKNDQDARESLYNLCNKQEDDLIFYTTKINSWNNSLIPFFDMLLHHYGHNNVDSNSVFENNDVTVFSTSDIEAGTQLFMSFDECAIECGHSKLSEPSNVIDHLLQDSYIFNTYPQRWSFFENIPYFNNSWNFYWRSVDKSPSPIKFELKQKANNQFIVKWLDGYAADPLHKHFLQGHFKRLRGSEHVILEEIQSLDGKEQSTIRKVFYSLKHAIQEALFWEKNAEVEGETKTCSITSCNYDNLTVDEYTYTQDFVQDRCSNNFYSTKMVDRVKTSFQELHYYKNRVGEDEGKCLSLDHYPHICTSMRPTYHEMFVHYPASFLNEVKRVAFFGGGDSMLLHEILKYPSLELVVGMELDQQVVRRSFKNFRTQPHFDNPKVEWWFADATKTLALLPEEYYGSFDLVVVDLLSDVIDMLEVSEGVTVMDAALSLMSPTGIIARNVDVWFDIDEGVTDYAVDIEFTNVPIFCYLRITFGSNSRNFLTAQPKDHGVDTIFYDPATMLNQSSRFDMYYNFRQRSLSPKVLSRNCCSDEIGNTTETISTTYGVLMVIEAEDAKVRDINSSQEAILQTLKHMELSEVRVHKSPEANIMTVILEEGYVIVRIISEKNYCAIDLLLWKHMDDLDKVKKGLLDTIRSENSSSYRFVSLGMPGKKKSAERAKLCKCEDGSSTVKERISIGPAPAELSDTVLVESMGIIPKPFSSIVLVCGEESSCSSLINKIGKKQVNEDLLIPILSCPTLLHNEMESSYKDSICSCSKEILQKLKSSCLKNGKIKGIYIASDVSKAMGQAFHKIFNNTSVRREILDESYVILQILDASWKRVLLDRFRSDYTVYDPAYRAEVRLFDDENINSLLGIFSAGDVKFFKRLVETVTHLENKLNLSVQVRNVLNGMPSYISDNKPRIYTYSDYDETSYREQKASQEEVAWQTLYRFKVSNVKFSDKISVKVIRKAIDLIFDWMERDEMQDINMVEYSSYEGGGAIVVADWSMGNLAILWNGGAELEMNLCSFYENRRESMEVHASAKEFLLEIIFIMELVSYDEFPRGIGRIVWV